MSYNILEDKVILVTGVANERSIATGIVDSLTKNGATVVLTYQDDNLEERVAKVAKKYNIKHYIKCNVLNDASLKQAFEYIESKFGVLHGVVHAIAFSDKAELRGSFIETSESNFLKTMQVSCYSLIRMTYYARNLMRDGGSIVTLTYYGSEKVIPNYNVMGVAKAALEASVRYLAADLGPFGIRVNAVSSGPIKTLASSAIGGFSLFLKNSADSSPLRRNVTAEEVGESVLYLLSNMSSATTGSVIYTDCGYNIMGMQIVEE